MAEDDRDPRSLRVSDRERDRAVGRLKDAVSEGLIDIDEFGERTSQALVARTRGELDAVTSDLPAGADAGPGTDDIVELKGSDELARAQGQLAGATQVGAPVADGLRQARFHGGQDRPPGGRDRARRQWAVRWKCACRKGRVLRWTEWRRGFGSIEDHRRGAPAVGRPHFVLKGQISRGSVEVRGPRRSTVTAPAKSLVRGLTPGLIELSQADGHIQGVWESLESFQAFGRRSCRS